MCVKNMLNHRLDNCQIVFSLILSFIISVLVVLISLPDIPYTEGDAPHYIKLAEQGPYTVQRPHSTRILPSLIVSFVNPILDTHKAFFY
jgi:hypothetical protein